MKIKNVKKLGVELLMNSLGLSLNKASMEVDSILCSELKKSRAYVLSYKDEEITREQEEGILSKFKRRASSEPIAYILENKEFYSLGFYVDSRVLIPRPETEELVELALDVIKQKLKSSQKESFEIYDICTGSGCIIISIADYLINNFKETTFKFTATDISQEALEVAKINQEHLLNKKLISFIQSDLASGLKLDADINTTKVILCNPPYVALDHNLSKDVYDYEPHLALFAELRGLDIIFKLINQLIKYLSENDCLIMEIGDKQSVEIGEFLNSKNIENYSFSTDLSNKKRFLIIGNKY